MTWRPDADSSHREAEKIAHLIVPYTRGRGLDIGSGDKFLFPHFIRVDSGKDFGDARIAEIKSDASDLNLIADESCDYVFSSHCLEHIADHKAALREWWRVIKPGGHLVLYLPHRDLYPKIGEPGSNPDHKHDFIPDDIIDAMKEIGSWTLLENEVRSGGNEYSFFLVFRKDAADE